VVLGDQDCWIDEHGHFGLAMHPGREPIGTPSGRYDYFFCSSVLCLDCTAEFHAVSKPAIDYKYGPHFTVQQVNPAPPTWKEWLAIVTDIQEIQDPFDPANKISCVNALCTRCGGKLFTKDELLVRVKGRDRLSCRHYPPVSESEDVAACPKCKAAPLEYKTYFMY